MLTLTFDPSSMSSGVILLQTPYISLRSPLLLILRGEIDTAAVVLLLLLSWESSLGFTFWRYLLF